MNCTTFSLRNNNSNHNNGQHNDDKNNTRSTRRCIETNRMLCSWIVDAGRGVDALDNAQSTKCLTPSSSKAKFNALLFLIRQFPSDVTSQQRSRKILRLAAIGWLRFFTKDCAIRWKSVIAVHLLSEML